MPLKEQKRKSEYHENLHSTQSDVECGQDDALRTLSGPNKNDQR